MSGAATSSVQFRYATNDTLATALPRLQKSQLEFQPGTRWSYSSQAGFDILARIVEITSGVNFDTFVQERIFKPLSMNDTFFYRDSAHPNLAKLYSNVEGKLEETPDRLFMNGLYFSGGGGLSSTAQDYLQFALMLLNDGELNGTRLVGRRSAELMRSAFIPSSLPGRKPGEGYGLGVLVVTDAVERETWKSNGSFGWAGAYNTYFFIDPVERVVGIYMTHVTGFPGAFTLMDDFETAVMQALVD
jgi:CubicO group peptidase (beta-lactamase class C family)